MRRERAKHDHTPAWEWLAVFTFVALTIYFVVPYFVRARAITSAPSCINNLRQIAEAKQQWALKSAIHPATLQSMRKWKPISKVDAPHARTAAFTRSARSATRRGARSKVTPLNNPAHDQTFFHARGQTHVPLADESRLPPDHRP